MTVMPAKIRVKRGKIGEAGRGRRFGHTHSHTHTRTRGGKSLPNNGQEDPILVVNHCVGISAQLRCAEDPYSVSVRIITLTFIYEVTNKVSTMLKIKIFIPLVRPYLLPLADNP